MTTVSLSDSLSTVRVGKIVCLARNYEAHAKEMRAEVTERPAVFLKPSTALLESGYDVVIPPFAHELHHEVELVVLIGRTGKNIERERALHHVAGYAVGLDMTLRDLQAEAKAHGLPWSAAKGFDTSAPVSSFVPREQIPDPHRLAISLTVNGAIRQQGNTSAMVLTIDRIVAFVSTLFTLEEGDLIFTGTPAGVGRVVPGDRLHATIETIGSLDVGVRTG